MLASHASRRFNGKKRKNESNAPQTLRTRSLYRIWHFLRSPFLLPPNISAHDCTEHFESFDSDLAGCRLCGALHECSNNACEMVCTDDAHVCRITGLCLQRRLIHEWVPNVGHVEAPPTRHGEQNLAIPRCYMRANTRSNETDSYHNSTMYFRLKPLLDSDLAKACRKQDNIKFAASLRNAMNVALRIVREDGVVNWVRVEEILHTHLRQQRIPARIVSKEVADSILSVAMPAITSLLAFVRKHCNPIPSCLKNAEISVGLLYQCRAGIIAHGTVLLPRIPLMSHVLPNELHLTPVFGIRAKTIAEAENAIKFCLRQLEPSVIASYAQRITSQDLFENN